MEPVVLSTYIEQLAIESSVLGESIRLLKNFSDFMYFIYLFNYRANIWLGNISTFKAISDSYEVMLEKSIMEPINKLLIWLNEAETKGLYEVKGSLSEDFLFECSIPHRKDVAEFLRDIEKKMSCDQKNKISRIAIISLRHFILSQFISFGSISKSRRLSLVTTYFSSCCWDDPVFIFGLPASSRNFIIEEIKDFSAKPPYAIHDNEIDEGKKKLVVIDIETAIENADIEYGKNLLYAFEYRDNKYIKQSINAIKSIINFFNSDYEYELPSNDMMSFRNDINIKTILSMIIAGKFQSTNQGFAIGDVDGDVIKRKYYIRFPNDYSYASSMLTLQRLAEYNESHALFMLNHQKDIPNCIRVRSAKIVLSKLENLNIEIFFESILKKIDEIGKITSNSIKNPEEIRVLCALSMILLSKLGIVSPEASQMATILLSYFILTKKKK